jgi:[acyl-carrier-protein] S-malonyltransferase
MTHNKAIVFPGQGSQFLGMLGDIAAAYPDVLGYFKQASSVLGYDLWDMVQAGPAELLDQTCHTQPALLTASYAIWQVLQAQGHQQPAYLAGHSLGEFSALVCAESLTFLDGVKLVALRGKLMQEAVATCDSALAAILGLDDQKITEICEAAKQAGEVLSPANFNCPGQVVIGGTRVAVERAFWPKRLVQN